jgi:hypothetical protein
MFWIGFLLGVAAACTGMLVLCLVLYAIGQVAAEESAELGPEKR